MSMKTKYILVVVVVSCLIVVASFIIPRLINVSPHTIATNATNADIVNAIYSLKDSLKDTIYTAMTIQICLTTTMMAFMFGVIIKVIAK